MAEARLILVSQPASVTDTTPVRLIGIPSGSKLRLRKILATNTDTANRMLELGTAVIRSDGTIDAATFTPITPPIVVAAGSTLLLSDLPAAEAAPVDPATGSEQIRALVVRLTAAAASPVHVQVEVEVA